MQGRSKPSLFFAPAIASLFIMCMSMPAFADKKMPKGLIGQEYAVEENNKQDTPLRQSGEAIRSVDAEPSAQAERVRPRDNRLDNRQDPAQVEQNREENIRNAMYQREQSNRQNIALQQQTERQAAVERIAMLRENSNNQRNQRDNQNERPDSRSTNGRHSERQYQGNYGSPENPIAFKPARPETQSHQWQDQQRQADEYRRHLNHQNTIAIRYNERLRDQNRREQYRSQQRYYERMNQQRRYYDNHHDDYNIAYYNSPVIYRYHRGGSYHYANRYQADLMRQAINYGYEEGFYAGRADRMDRWGYNFREAYAYQDANYGYNGYYVDRGTYNYYFREGFRRGYDDGYYSRYQYGRHYNNRYSPHDSVIRLILNFSNWR
jgi:hypothetical protein